MEYSTADLKNEEIGDSILFIQNFEMDKTHDTYQR